MKKIMVLLLMAVMSLSVIACGGKESQGENNVSQKTEQDGGTLLFKTQKEIEITTDNWQEYFEIRFDFGSFEFTKNAFDEIEGVDVSNGGTVFSLKEEYMDSFVSVDVAIEVFSNEAKTTLVKYNLEDNTYELIEYIETEWTDPPFYEIPANFSDETYMEKVADASIMLNPNRNFYEVDSIEDNYVNMYTITYPNCEIVRIQGTLVIKD